jgi:branched-chain amino acid transport system permease protein
LLLVIVSGLALGGLYGMTALVYNVMYSTSKVLSFGTGQFAMVGGICTAFLVLNLHWPVWAGLLACLASGVVFGWLSEVIAVRRIVAVSDEHLWVLSTLALSTMVQEAMGLWWGTDPTPFPRVFPQDFAGALDQKFWLPILAAIGMAAGLELFYRHSMLGKLFIAISEDAFAARARGVATDRMRAISYMIAGVLGALSGFVAGQLTFADFALGTALGLSGFIALALGGIGSSAGAVIGGATLGLMTSFTTHYFGAQYQKTIAIGLLVILLVVRPQGLFGTQRVRHV